MRGFHPNKVSTVGTKALILKEVSSHLQYALESEGTK